jgi:hypothetical protein
LSEGLVVLRADNSRGKSTSVQSFLFALGLERMITARPANVVTSAMRDRLIYDADTREETPVLASWVSLEIEGDNGEVATLTRWVKHEEINTGLVRVVLGPELTSPGDYPTEDFLRRACRRGRQPPWIPPLVGVLHRLGYASVACR